MHSHLTQSADIAKSGPKGGRLLQLRQAEFPVPELTCISSGTYQAYIQTIPEYCFFVEEQHSTKGGDETPPPSAFLPTFTHTTDEHHHVSPMLKKFRAAAHAVAVATHFRRKHMFVRSASGLVSNAMASRSAKDDLVAAAEAVRTKILELELSPELLTEIKTFLSSLCMQSPSISVRSSCVGLEDSTSRAFAGQFTTVLNCKDMDTIAKAVKTVWASLWEARLIAFLSVGKTVHDVRRLLGSAQMAVILQCQISSFISGICFSVNPTGTSSTEVLLESVFGQGEGIVSGAVEPDRFIVDYKKAAADDDDKEGRTDGGKEGEKKILSSEISVKDSHLTLQSAGGLENVSGSGQEEQTLSNDQVFHVCEVAKKLERFYENTPQDIEFAFDQNGKFFLLQTRPITASALMSCRGESEVLEPDPVPEGIKVKCPFLVSDYETAIPDPNYTYNLDHIHVTSALSHTISALAFVHLNRGFRDAAKVYGSPVTNQILIVNGYVFGYLLRGQITEELKQTASQVFKEKNYLRELGEWNQMKEELPQKHLALQTRVEKMIKSNKTELSIAEVCTLVSDCWKHAEECMYIHGKMGWAHRIVLGDLMATYDKLLSGLEVLNLIARLVVGTPNCRLPVLRKIVDAFTANPYARELLLALEPRAPSSSTEPSIDGSIPKDADFHEAENILHAFVSGSIYNDDETTSTTIKKAREKLVSSPLTPQKNDPSKLLVQESVKMFQEWHSYVICGSTDIRCASYQECPYMLVGILQDIVKRFCGSSIKAAPSTSHLFQGDLSKQFVFADPEFKILCEKLPSETQREAFQQSFFDALQCSVLKNDRVLYTDAWSNGILRACYLYVGEMLVEGGYLKHRGHVFELSVETIIEYLTLFPAKGQAAHITKAEEIEHIVIWKSLAGFAGVPKRLGAASPSPPKGKNQKAKGEGEAGPPQDRVARAVQMYRKCVSEDAGAEKNPIPEDLLVKLGQHHALRGIAASKGTTEGFGRYIENPMNIPQLQPGEIAIITQASPAFGGILANCIGVVSETGGILCHIAICARELHLPAVVGCGKSIISKSSSQKKLVPKDLDGKRLRIYGGLGVVEVLPTFDNNTKKSSASCSICVLGATGRLGSAVAFQALQRGHEVHGIVRSLERANEIFFPEEKKDTTTDDESLRLTTSQLNALHLTQGNPMDAKQLLPLVEKCQVVINCIGPRDYMQASDEVSASTKAAIEAIMAKKEEEIKTRFILTGGIVLLKRPGPDHQRWCDVPGVVPPFLQKPTNDMCMAVKLLAEGAVPHVIMAPGRFIPGSGNRQTLQFVNETPSAEKWRSRVYIGDLAAAMVDLSSRDEDGNKQFPASGTLMAVESSDAMLLEIDESEAFKRLNVEEKK